MVAALSSSHGIVEAYQRYLRPTLFRLDPEKAHELMYQWTPRFSFLAGQFQNALRFEDPSLHTEFAGHTFDNPIGLAAGFDKNARLDVWLDALGLGFAEIGSITARASQGNPLPRLFRLPGDEAVINRLGLNGDGAEVVAKRAAGLRCRTPYAINIAKSNHPSIVGEAAIADLLDSFMKVKNLPLTYLTVNASCPNTHDGITRETQELEAAMQEMQLRNERLIPIFLKLSPDSSDSLLESLVDLGRRLKVSGFICGNTTVSRENLSLSDTELTAIGKGGLSGRPLKPLAYALCKKVVKMKDAYQSVIACGGIASGEDVFQFLQIGVSAIQLYTALIYKGPAVAMEIKIELAEILRRHGTTVTDVIASSGRQALNY
jgi:dihydroorotate dehydrogenase